MTPIIIPVISMVVGMAAIGLGVYVLLLWSQYRAAGGAARVRLVQGVAWWSIGLSLLVMAIASIIATSMALAGNVQAQRIQAYLHLGTIGLQALFLAASAVKLRQLAAQQSSRSPLD